MDRPLDLRNVGEELDRAERLDVVVDPMRKLVDRLLPEGDLKTSLQGASLGHPVHPLLTDLPIGFWTSAWVLDLVGGRRSRPAADAFVGLGVLCALPTVATGVADWTTLPRGKQRSGAIHAASNLLATALYTASFLQRRRGQRIRGVALGMAGATAATVGGYLGGHLAFGGSGDTGERASDATADGDESAFVPGGPLERIS